MKNDINKELRENRAQKAARSAFMGIINIVLTTFIPFLLRTMMVKELGEEYLGLNSLFQSILSLLNMTEMGTGAVMGYFLYAPAAHNDIKKVDAYLAELRKIYHVIGFIILAVGLAVMPTLNRLMAGGSPDGANIYLLFFLYLLTSVLDYWIYPEQITLFSSFQRTDISYVINFAGNVFAYTFQIIALLMHNYFLYVLILVFQVIFMGIMKYYYKMKFFSEYVPKGEVTAEEKKAIWVRIASMMGHQMDTRLLNSADNMFISSILGLAAVAVYGNYFLIISAVSQFFAVFQSALQASIGNALVTENKESNLARLQSILFLSSCVAGWGTACIMCLTQNFMQLWMGKAGYGNSMVILFCIYFYIAEMRRSVQLFKNAGGMWYNDRFKPYVSVAVDLALDFVLIPVIGVKGAIISSIICIGLIELPWETKVLFRDYFNKSPIEYLGRICEYTVINILVTAGQFWICEQFISPKGLLPLFERFITCTFMTCFIYLLLYHRTKEYKTWKVSVLGLITSRYGDK